MRITPVSSRKLSDEQRLKQLAAASQIVESDPTKFNELCEKFRSTCAEIGAVINRPMFMGSYDEIEEIMNNEEISMTPKFQALYNKLNVLNSSCRHEGEKLGYRFAEWWKTCWKERISQTVSQPV